MDQSKSVPANDIAGKNMASLKNMNSAARPASTQGSVKPSEVANQAKTKVSNEIVLSEAERRHAMIAEAAYLIAEQRQFEAGHDMDDWLAAESALKLR